eukprot:Hpha_TRINITY_DN10935_c0_g1::TRINITY_DN10935_c0_g1_i1::g.26740::m.26740/K06640/ATR; serine/threonine-protein kinase ATR
MAVAGDNHFVFELWKKADELRLVILRYKDCQEEARHNPALAQTVSETAREKEDKAEQLVGQYLDYLRKPDWKLISADDKYALIRMASLAHKETRRLSPEALAEVVVRSLTLFPHFASGGSKEELSRWEMVRDFLEAVALDASATAMARPLLRGLLSFLTAAADLLVSGWSRVGEDVKDTPARGLSIPFMYTESPEAAVAEGESAPQVVIRNWRDLYSCATVAICCAMKLFASVPAEGFASQIISVCALLGRMRWFGQSRVVCAAAMTAAVRRLVDAGTEQLHPPAALSLFLLATHAGEGASPFVVGLGDSVPTHAFNPSGQSDTYTALAPVVVPLLTAVCDHIRGPATLARLTPNTLLPSAVCWVAGLPQGGKDAPHERLRACVFRAASLAGKEDDFACATICCSLLRADRALAVPSCRDLFLELLLPYFREQASKPAAAKRRRVEGESNGEAPSEAPILSELRGGPLHPLVEALWTTCRSSTNPSCIAVAARLLGETGAPEAAQAGERALELALTPGQATAAEVAGALGCLLRMDSLCGELRSRIQNALLEAGRGLVAAGSDEAAEGVRSVCETMARFPQQVLTNDRLELALLATNSRSEQVSAAALQQFAHLLDSLCLTPVARGRVAQRLLAAHKAGRPVMRFLPEILPVLYSPHHGAAPMDVDEPPAPEAEQLGDTFKFHLWQRYVLPKLTAAANGAHISANLSDDQARAVAEELCVLASMIKLSDAGTLSSIKDVAALIREVFVQGDTGAGLLTHASEPVRSASREVAGALMNIDLVSGGTSLAAVCGGEIDQRGGTVGTVAVQLAKVIERCDAVRSRAAAAQALRMATHLACDTADAANEGPLYCCLYAIIRVLLHQAAVPGGGLLGSAAKATLARADQKHGAGMKAVLAQYPELCKAFFAELPVYNQARRATAVPALSVAGDIFDAEIEVVMLDIAPVAIPWVIRDGENVVARLHALCECLKHLPSDRLEQVFSLGQQQMFGDRQAALTKMLMHFYGEILGSIMLHTTGEGDWAEYSKRCLAQLGVYEQVTGSQALSQAVANPSRHANVTLMVVHWAGKSNDVGLGQRSLGLLTLLRDHTVLPRGPQVTSVLPKHQDICRLTEGELARKASEALSGDLFYRVFDNFDKDRNSVDLVSADVGKTIVSLRKLRFLINLLAPEGDDQQWEKYCTKLTPTLQCFLRLSVLTGKDAERVRPEIFTLWADYFQALPPTVVLRQLPSLVVLAMGLSRFDNAQSEAVQRLCQLHRRSLHGASAAARNMAQERWHEVVNIIPRTSEYAVIFEVIDSPNRSNSFCGTLKSLLKGLHSPSKEYRSITLSSLHTLLQEQGVTVRGLCSGREAAGKEGLELVGSVERRLLEMLARDRQHDPDAMGWIMSCIGKIGALSPGVMRRLRKSERVSASRTDLDDESFAVALLDRYIVKALQSGGPTTGGAAAFAAQEIFIHLMERSRIELGRQDVGVTGRKSEEDRYQEAKRYPWWEKLSVESQTKLRPFLNTRYKIDVVVKRDQKEIEYTPRMDFRTWLRALLIGAIGRTGGDRGRILRVLRNTVKSDVDMGIFILPFVIDNIATHADTTHRMSLASEFEAILSAEMKNPGSATEHVQVLCSALDKLVMWRDRLQCDADEQRKVRARGAAAAQAMQGKRLEGLNCFLRRIDSIRPKIATACRGHNPARALRYIEQYLRAVRADPVVATQATQTGAHRWCHARDVRLFQDIYSRLDEPDGLVGIASLRQAQAFSEELGDQAVDLETMGQWTEAIRRYELLVERHPEEREYQERLLRCMQHVGQYTVMLSFAGTRSNLRRYALQAAWRLGSWSTVASVLEETGRRGEESVQHTNQTLGDNFELGVGLSLLHMHKGEHDKVGGVLDTVRGMLHSDVAAAALESYEAAYPHLVRLHALEDLHLAAIVAGSPGAAEEGERMQQRLMEDLRQRAEATRGCEAGAEVLLAVRRSIACLLGREKDVASTWLEWGKRCRKRGLYEVANAALLRAESSDPRARPEGLAHQQAKLLWEKGERLEGLRVMTDALNGENPGRVRSAEMRSKMRLLALNWARELNQRSQKEINQEYEQILSTDSSENTPFHYARYLDQQYEEFRRSTAASKWQDFSTAVPERVPRILDLYLRALRGGSKHLYHALPRVLGVYFDSVAQLTESAGPDHVRKAAEIVRTLSDRMLKVVQQLPPAVLYAGLPNIVCRIAHPSREVIGVVGHAVRRVLEVFPERAVWAVMGVQLSKQDGRRSRNFLEHVQQEMKRHPDKYKAALRSLEQCGHLTDCINRIAAARVENTRALNFRTLDYAKRLLRRMPMDIVVPSQDQLVLSSPLPLGGSAADFFAPPARLHSIDNEVAVMNSLQKPKRLTFRTTMGTAQAFLCKARDELRKDARVMDLCHIMNILLAKDTEARQRQLVLKTFAVTITGDDSGMIEWVNDVETFRAVCDRLYNRSAFGMTTAEIRPVVEDVRTRKLTNIEAYRDKILPRFPPLLHRWFAQEFADPIAWFNARNAFTRSTAAWSMVGHVLGMGDRHAENILMDRNTGAVMHVDFAILFDKGMTLEVPEITRFRLTPNIVDAMGISGCEGVFRRSAELTMDVMRSHRDMVMGVLNLFLHDPLIDWTPKESRNHNRPVTADELRPQAERTLTDIRRRLDGYFEDPNDLLRRRRQRTADAGAHDGMPPLNIQGQVQKLINNATSVENLGRMYIWWMPWL